MSRMRTVRADGMRGQAGTAEVGVSARVGKPPCQLSDYPLLGYIVTGLKCQSLFQQLKS